MWMSWAGMNPWASRNTRPFGGRIATSTTRTAWPGVPGWMKTSPTFMSSILATGFSSAASDTVPA